MRWHLHDERLDATVNQAFLGQDASDRIAIRGGVDSPTGGEEHEAAVAISGPWGLFRWLLIQIPAE